MEHIVLFKWKEGVDADAIMKKVEDLRNSISCIQSISVGENFTDRGKGFTHALIVRLPDRESLELYRDHPAHKQVLEEIGPAKEDVLAIDMDCARRPGPHGRNEDIGRMAIASVAGAALGFVAAAVFRRMNA